MSSQRRPGPTQRRNVTEISESTRSVRWDSVLTEEPLEIRLGWPGHRPSSVAVVMRTPGHDFELASGFLLAEGAFPISRSPSTVAYCVDRTLNQEQRYNVVTVTLTHAPLRVPTNRATQVSSACGVCGATSLDEVLSPVAEPQRPMPAVPAERIAGAFRMLSAHQPLFDQTGASHAAAIYSGAGDLVVLREDVGRHNAVDKVLGARVLGTTTYGDDAMLCVSGRVGFDIMAKAVAGRIGLVAAVGAPSSLAVDLAQRAGITICGFVRSDRLVVYTAPERVTATVLPAVGVAGRC